MNLKRRDFLKGAFGIMAGLSVLPKPKSDGFKKLNRIGDLKAKGMSKSEINNYLQEPSFDEKYSYLRYDIFRCKCGQKVLTKSFEYGGVTDFVPKKCNKCGSIIEIN